MSNSKKMDTEYAYLKSARSKTGMADKHFLPGMKRRRHYEKNEPVPHMDPLFRHIGGLFSFCSEGIC